MTRLAAAQCFDQIGWDVARAPAGFQRTTALKSMETWSSVHGEARSTVCARLVATAVGVSTACGVSMSIASSLLAGVAVVDARAFFFGGMVLAQVLEKLSQRVAKRILGLEVVAVGIGLGVKQLRMQLDIRKKRLKADWFHSTGTCRGKLG